MFCGDSAMVEDHGGSRRGDAATETTRRVHSADLLGAPFVSHSPLPAHARARGITKTSIGESVTRAANIASPLISTKSKPAPRKGLYVGGGGRPKRWAACTTAKPRRRSRSPTRVGRSLIADNASGTATRMDFARSRCRLPAARLQKWVYVGEGCVRPSPFVSNSLRNQRCFWWVCTMRV